MTLSFGASEIGLFVDGGQWEYKSTRGMDPITGLVIGEDLDFSGNYVTFLERFRNAKLTGRMNLFVRALGGQRTEVKVRARYVVNTTTAIGSRVVSDTWSFDTGGSDTISVRNPSKGTGETRTMRPTHEAEKSILDAIDALSGKTP